MSIKTDKLAQRIQELQKLVAAKSNQEVVYGEIILELDAIANSLKVGKLSLQIYSNFPLLAQALAKFLHSISNLSDYQFTIANFPKDWQQDKQQSSATLVLNLLSTSGQQQSRYPLTSREKVLVGRRPGCQIIIPDTKDRISGEHLEIQALAETNLLNWEICDHSTNGTYINEQRLVKGSWTKLKTGDRITLGDSSLNNKTAELIFEFNVNQELGDEVDKQLANCDVLCLVINPIHLISDAEKEFIEKASKAAINKLFIVTDTSVTSGQVPQTAIDSFAAIKSQINRENINLELQLIPLFLKPFFPNASVTNIDPNYQGEFDAFCQGLQIPGKGGYEEILIKRINAQVFSQIDRIEQLINLQQEELNQKIQGELEKLQNSETGDLKEQAKSALQKVKSEKDKFFSKVKSELSQSKATMLDEFSKRSILTQVKIFTDNLKPVVVRREGYTYLQLQAENSITPSDVNNMMTHLCRNSLINWGNEEWQRICTTYADGGLNELLQRSYNILNIKLSANSFNLLVQPIQPVGIERVLQGSLLEAVCEVRYQELSLIGYLTKNTKAQVTSIVSTIMCIISPFSTLLFPGSNLKKALISAGLILFVLAVAIPFLIISYDREKPLKLEQDGEKIKKDLCSYFQSLTKSLVEKIVQILNQRLEVEDQRIKGIIETIGEELAASIAETEKQQALVKVNLEKIKLQQKSLEKEKADLQKFKLI